MAATSALDFFDRFTAPTLNTIDITSWPMQQPAGIPALIRRSQCSLKTLILHKSSVRVGEVLETLSLSPNLETLVIAHGGQTTITNRFFDALTIRQDVPMQAPRLRHLIIQGEYLF
jgi:hypothetical protein